MRSCKAQKVDRHSAKWTLVSKFLLAAGVVVPCNSEVSVVDQLLMLFVVGDSSCCQQPTHPVAVRGTAPGPSGSVLTADVHSSTL